MTSRNLISISDAKDNFFHRSEILDVRVRISLIWSEYCFDGHGNKIFMHRIHICMYEYDHCGFMKILCNYHAIESLYGRILKEPCMGSDKVGRNQAGPHTNT